MKKAFVLPLLLITITGTAFCQWSEQQITTGNWWKGTPKVWDQAVYWTDRHTSKGQIYAWSQSSGQHLVLGGDGIDRSLYAVWGNSMVVDHYASGQTDLYLYDPLVGETPITTAPGDQAGADIYQATVVYEDHSGTYSQVMIWDEAGGSRPVCPSNSNQTKPKIWGDTVVWQDDRTGAADTWKWDAAGGAVDLGWGSSPAVYDGRIVSWQPAYYWRDSHGTHFADGYLWQWTAGGGKVNLASHQWTTGFENTDMWGDLVAIDGRAWEPVHGFTDPGVIMPSVWGNQIAGVRGSNIYLETLVPEPSGGVILGWLLGMSGLIVRQRRGRRSNHS